MLDFLRRGVRSWVVKVLLGLLVASFAVWGIGDIGAGFSTRVATVGEREVPADLYATTLRQQQQQFGLDPTQIRSLDLDNFVLAQMVREAAIEVTVDRLGISTPDEAVARQVRADPAFRISGNFDPVQYESAVTRVFASVAAFEATVRDDIAARQLVIATTGGTVPPSGAARMIDRFREQRRTFDAVFFALSSDDIAAPDDTTLTAHLTDNEARFQQPETRTARWLHIDPATLGEDIEIDEAELRELFQARRAAYDRPETREIRQIVFADMSAAEAAAARLAGGELDFAALMAEEGLEPAMASLGTLSADDLPGARGTAAFTLEAPGIAGPVTTPGGAALLEVLAITPGQSAAFDDLAEALRTERALELAQPEADRLAEEVEDLSAGGATVPEITGELGLTLHRADKLSADGAGSLPGSLSANPVFLAEVFEAGIAEERRLLPGPAGGYFLIEVEAIAPPAVPPLDDIRDAVLADWRTEQARAARRAEAQAMAEVVAGGGDLATLAEEAGLTINQVGPLRRGDPDPRLGATIHETLFDGEIGATGIAPAPGGISLIVLREITDPPEAGAGAQSIEGALSQTLAQDQLEYLGRALEAQAGISINRQTIDAVLAQIGG